MFREEAGKRVRIGDATAYTSDCVEWEGRR